MSLLTASRTSQGCLLYLLRGHELELCVVIARQLLFAGGGETAALTPFVDTAVRYLSYRAAWLALPEVAVDLASTHSQVWATVPHSCCELIYWSSSQMKLTTAIVCIMAHGKISYFFVH